MGRKPKFKPMITRIKLNPEQAVLSCTCSGGGWRITGIGNMLWTLGGTKTNNCAILGGPIRVAGVPTIASS